MVLQVSIVSEYRTSSLVSPAGCAPCIPGYGVPQKPVLPGWGISRSAADSGLVGVWCHGPGLVASPTLVRGFGPCRGIVRHSHMPTASVHFSITCPSLLNRGITRIGDPQAGLLLVHLLPPIILAAHAPLIIGLPRCPLRTPSLQRAPPSGSLRTRLPSSRRAFTFLPWARRLARWSLLASAHLRRHAHPSSRCSGLPLSLAVPRSFLTHRRRPASRLRPSYPHLSQACSASYSTPSPHSSHEPFGKLLHSTMTTSPLATRSLLQTIWCAQHPSLPLQPPPVLTTLPSPDSSLSPRARSSQAARDLPASPARRPGRRWVTLAAQRGSRYDPCITTHLHSPGPGPSRFFCQASGPRHLVTHPIGARQQVCVLTVLPRASTLWVCALLVSSSSLSARFLRQLSLPASASISSIPFFSIQLPLLHSPSLHLHPLGMWTFGAMWKPMPTPTGPPRCNCSPLPLSSARAFSAMSTFPHSLGASRNPK